MKVYFITRFSVLDHGHKSFNLTRDNNELDYAVKLFSTERMGEKFEVFEKVTLPSVLSQTNKEYKWLIFASNYLPQIYKERLANLLDQHAQIELRFVESFKEIGNILKTYPLEKNYATVRLDDDDGIGKKLVELLQLYKDKDQSIISFPYGNQYKLENGAVLVSENDHFVQKIALGLSAINMNIQNCGNHKEVDQHYRVIYNDTRGMYLLFCSPLTDTARKFKE